MARGKQPLKNLQEGFEQLHLAAQKVEEARKGLEAAGRIISKRVALEQEELKPIVQTFSGWEVLYREEKMVLRSSKVEVHILWPDTLENPVYRIGAFLLGDKTCVTILELPVDTPFEEVKSWIATKLMDEVARL